MTDRIFIHGLSLHAYHGVMAHEAKVGQTFTLDLELQIDLSAAARTDKVVDTIAARCTEVETGARNIDFILRGTVMPMLSHEILIRMSEAEQPTHAELDVNDEGVFVVSFGFEPAEAKAAVIEEEAQ